jgi:hypothetical protein
VALKIQKAQPKQTAPAVALTPRALQKMSLASFLGRGPLKHYLLTDHPLLALDPVAQTQNALTFRLSLRHDPARSALAVAPMLAPQLTGGLALDAEGFQKAFEAAVSALLFWHGDCDARENLMLIDCTSRIQWHALIQYAGEAVQGLPVVLEVSADQGFLHLFLTPVAPVVAASVALNVSQEGMENAYADTVRQQGQAAANEGLKADVLDNLAQMLLSLMTPAKAEDHLARRLAEEQTKAALRDPGYALLGPTAEAAKGQMGSTIESMRI